MSPKPLKRYLAEQVDKLGKTSALRITNAGKTDDAVTYRCYFDMRVDGDALHNLTTAATLRGVSRLSMMRTLVREAFTSARKTSNHAMPSVGDHGDGMMVHGIAERIAARYGE